MNGPSSNPNVEHFDMDPIPVPGDGTWSPAIDTDPQESSAMSDTTPDVETPEPVDTPDTDTDDTDIDGNGA